MKIIEKIVELFGVQENLYTIQESFTDVSIKFKPTFPISNNHILITLNELIEDNYNLTLLYNEDARDTYHKTSPDSAETFMERVNELFDSLDLDDEDDLEYIDLLSFELIIIKSVSNNGLNIYCFDSFLQYWDSLSFEHKLLALSEPRRVNGLNFVLKEEGISSFNTKAFKFSHNIEGLMPIEDYSSIIAENVYGDVINRYKLSPEHFHVTQESSSQNIIEKDFCLFSTLFSICALFDIVSLDVSTNKLQYKLIGYKNIQGEIDITQSKDKLVDVEEQYYKLFKWVYIDKGNIPDKIGIVRNILSLSISDSDLTITENVYQSVKSAFQIYLKENLNKYVAIRNQIYQELDYIVLSASHIRKDFLTSFKQSIFSCLSFFLGSIMVQVLNNKPKDIIEFSRPTSCLCLAVLVISLLFWIFQSYEIRKEKDAIRLKFEALKNRYKDLLIEEEIDSIFRDGQELENQIESISEYVKLYSILWFIIVFILGLIISILSPSMV